MRWNFWKRQPPAPAPELKPAEQLTRSPDWRGLQDLVARLAAQEQPKANPFAVTPPPPGVLPGGARDMAMDETINVLARWGGEFAGSEGVHWLGYALLSEMAQRPEYRRISSVRAQEMTRKWVRLVSAGEEDKNERIQQILEAMRRFKVRDAFRRAAELDGLFGRGHIYIDTGRTDDPEELKTPLFIHKDKVGIGSLKGFRIVEPIFTYPGQYSSVDPLRPDFYRPTTWLVMAKEVHATRLLTFVGREMPQMLQPAYQFGGMSMTQMAKPYVDWWLRDRTSVSDLVNYFSTSVLKTNMAAQMQGREGEGLIERIEAFVKLRKNRGVLVVDKDTEDFANVSAPLGTLDKLQAQALEHICSAVGMPLVKYTGITPSGLNASSDGEIRVWYDNILAEQEEMFTDNLDRVLRIIQLSEFGEIDEGIQHEFVQLWQLDEAGAAAVEKTKADTAAVFIESGVITPEEERRRLADDAQSNYHGLEGDAPGLPEGGEEDFHNLGDPSGTIERQGAEGSEEGANAGV
jgi:uncharacterized protein